MTPMRSLMPSTSGRSLEIRMHGEALLREAADDLVDLALGADVDALRRFVEDEQLGLGREPAGEGDFLLVAAGKAAAGRVGAGALHGEVADEIEGELALGAEAQPRAGKMRRMDRHRHVVGDGQLEDHAVAAAIFGDVGDAVGDGLAAVSWSETRLAVECRSRRQSAGVRPKRTRASSVRPAPTRPAESEDFAGTNFEAKRLCTPAGGAADAVESESTVAPGVRFGGG